MGQPLAGRPGPSRVRRAAVQDGPAPGAWRAVGTFYSYKGAPPHDRSSYRPSYAYEPTRDPLQRFEASPPRRAR